MSDRILLMVDVSNQAYKAAATNPNLSSDGIFTGGLYGFICAIAKAIHQTSATDICLCEDRKPYIRSTLYPEYKSLRKNTKDPVLVERVNTTVEQIRKLCEVTGWPIWSIPTFESDDLIARAVIHYRHRYNKIIAMSNDSDLYQLFKYKHFEMYKGKKGIYTLEDFDEEWEGMNPELLPLALSLIGTHNEVEGVKGIGQKRAIQMLVWEGENECYKPEYNNYQIGNQWLDETIILHGDLIKRNLELIKLPHKDFPRDERMPLRVVKYEERQLQSFLSRYGIKMERWLGENFERVK